MERVYKDIARALKSSLPRNTPLPKDSVPINVIRQLLVAGANPNVEYVGKTILELACLSNMEDVAKLLIDYGADVNGIGSALHSEPPIYGVLDGALNQRLIKLLLKNGADPNMPHKTKTSPLFEACRFLNIEIIKILLDYDADPNIQNRQGNTCLHLLINNPISELRIEIIKLLLDSGADKNIYNNVGQTPLDLIRIKFKSSNDKMYKELIELFSDTNTGNNTSLGVNNTTTDTHIIPFKSLHMENVEGMTILTIPKGTLLYNSFAVDETEPSEEVLLKLMGGILPFSTSVTIGQNTIYIRSCLDQFSQKFFYSSPVGGVALGGVNNTFNATAVFETKRDLRVAVLMTPTDYHRLDGKKHPSKINCVNVDSRHCQCALKKRGNNNNANEITFDGGGNHNNNNNGNNYNNDNNYNNNYNTNNNNNNNNTRRISRSYTCEFGKIYDVCIKPRFLHKHSLDGHIAVSIQDSYDEHMDYFDITFMGASLFGKKMHALNRILFDGGLSLDNRDNAQYVNDRGTIYGLPEIVLHTFNTDWYGDKKKISVTHTLDIPPESSEEDTLNILSKFLIDYNNDKVPSLGFQTPLKLIGVSTAKQFHNFMTGVQKPNLFFGNPRMKNIIYNFYVNHLTAFIDGDLRFFFDTRTGFLMNEKGIPSVQMEDGSIVSFADLSTRGAPPMEGATLLEKSFAARKAGTFWNKSDCLIPKVAAAAAGAGAGAGQAGGKLLNKTRNLLRRKTNNRITRKNIKMRTPQQNIMTVRNAPKKANPYVMSPKIEDLYRILLAQVRASA